MTSHRERDFFDDLAGRALQDNPAAPPRHQPQPPQHDGAGPPDPPNGAAAESSAAQEHNELPGIIQPPSPPSLGVAASAGPALPDRSQAPQAWAAPVPGVRDRPGQQHAGPRPPEPAREPLNIAQRPPGWSASVPTGSEHPGGGEASSMPPRQRESTPAAAHGSGPVLLRERLRPSDLIAPRKPIPSRGWRKALYRLSFKSINVGQSADEREVVNLIGDVGANLRGTYTIAVLGGKGGAGKTVTTAAVGSMFKAHRTDPVVAIDADPAQAANLAARVDPKSASMREINADTQLVRYSDVRSYTGQNRAGLDVVASPHHANASGGCITAAEFGRAHTVLQRFYNILLVDCGVNLDDPVMPEVLGRADAIVMVASAVADGAVGADTNCEWLHQAGYQQLLSRMVLVLNHIRGSTSRKERKATRQLVASLVEDFSRWLPRERIFVMPYDPHIATAGIMEIDALRPVTHRRFLEVAASLASGFTATTDRR